MLPLFQYFFILKYYQSQCQIKLKLYLAKSKIKKSDLGQYLSYHAAH